MSLQDAKARLIARLAPNAPQLALSDGTVLMAVAQALLAEAEDVRSAITAVQPTLFVATASGSDLDARAADYGVLRTPGTAATATVVFKAPAAVPSTVSVPAGTVVTTAGDGITVIPQAFATSALAQIPPGATTSASNQQETVTITGSPTGGTFTLTHAGQTTGTIAYNASAATVQSALQALSNVGLNSVTGAANVAVSGSAGGPWVVTWQGNLGGLPLGVMTANSAGLTGGTSPTATPAITSAVGGVTVTNTQNGAAGNVAAGTIVAFATQVTNLVVSNATADGGTAATGGSDPDADAVVRSKVSAIITPRWGTAAVEAAILAVPGVYDAYVSDPQNGSGVITYYWCDALGNQTNSSYPNMASQVTTAVQQAIPPSVTANSATFSVQNLTSIAVSYSAPSAVQTSTVAPQIQAAVVAYVQGNGNPRSGLQHNQIPNAFAMGAAVQSGLNAQSNAPLNVTPVVGLTLFTLTSTTPAIGDASQTTLYRVTGVPSAVVVATRV
jgi:hypothetical protein